MKTILSIVVVVIISLSTGLFIGWIKFADHSWDDREKDLIYEKMIKNSNHTQQLLKEMRGRLKNEKQE